MAVAVCDEIAGLVLAGGRGSRMGGLDKGWARFRGSTLIRHVMERFSPQVASVLISANRNLERYRELGVEVVADDTELAVALEVAVCADQHRGCLLYTSPSPRD